jgi:hypothetical protein
MGVHLLSRLYWPQEFFLMPRLARYSATRALPHARMYTASVADSATAQAETGATRDLGRDRAKSGRP